MLRIQKGQEERHVWPVHLSGWLALGWRVAAATVPASLEPDSDSAAESNAKTASTRGKRARRSRDEPDPNASADVAPIPQSESPAEEAPLSALPEGLLDDPLI
jgi:hypothetical protein